MNSEKLLRFFHRHYIVLSATACAFFVVSLRLGDFTGVRYATSDNIDYGVSWFGDVPGLTPMSLAWNILLEQSRPNHITSTLIDILVSGIHNQILYDILNIGSFILAVFLVALIIGIFTTTWLSIFYTTLFFSFFPLLWHHTPPAAYPVWPWLPVITFSIAVLAYLDYLKRGRRYSLFIAGLLFFASLFSLEIFVLALPLCAIAIAHSAKNMYGASSRFLVFSIATILVLTTVYLALYGGLRLYTSSAYDGATIGNVNARAFFQTVFQYSIGGSIFYYLLRGEYQIFYRDSFDESIISLIPQFGVIDVFVDSTLLHLSASVASAVLCVIALRYCRDSTRAKTYFLIGAGSVFFAFLSLSLYGLSAKYSGIENEHSAYFTAYLGTRYAYFAWTLFFICAVILLAKLVKPNPITNFALVSLVAVFVFVGSMTSFFFNAKVNATMRVQKAKWDVVDLAVQCAAFESHRSKRMYSAPRLESFVWWAPIRKEHTYSRTIEYWDRYTQKILGIDGQGWKTTLLFNDDVLFFDYRIGNMGEILGVFSAQQTTPLRAAQVAIISDRIKAVQMIFQDQGEHRVEILSWGMQSHACGNYMVNIVNGKDIDLGSIVLLADHVVPLTKSRPRK